MEAKNIREFAIQDIEAHKRDCASFTVEQAKAILDDTARTRAAFEDRLLNMSRNDKGRAALGMAVADLLEQELRFSDIYKTLSEAA